MLRSAKSKIVAFTLVAVSSLLGVAGVAFGQDTETLSHFDAGNEHYERGEYEGAAAEYEAAIQTGYHSTALHYNLGNAYYRLDEIGKAILNYERALLLDPENRAITHSLNLAKTRMMDRMTALPDPFWTTTWRKVVAAVSLSGVLWTGLALYTLGFALIILRILRGAGSAWLRRSALGALAIGIPLVAVSLISSRTATERPRSVVLESVVSVKTEPGGESPTELEIHEGLVVKTIDTDSSWIRVRLPNGVTGWIESSAVEHI